MKAAVERPWASGPGENLRHGLALLKTDSDTNRRLAFIAIDNAVELMTKTYLGLPKRITGLSIPRKEFTDASESFPGLINLLENYASHALDGIDLGTIEWYHRLRNELYHQGNGLTVERDKVEAYAVLANQLFANLFGVPLVEHLTSTTDMLGQFIQAWTTIERSLSFLAERQYGLDRSHAPAPSIFQYLHKLHQDLRPSLIKKIQSYRVIRNQILHSKTDYREMLNAELLSDITATADELEKLAAQTRPAVNDSLHEAKEA